MSLASTLPTQQLEQTIQYIEALISYNETLDSSPIVNSVKGSKVTRLLHLIMIVIVIVNGTEV